MLTPLFTALALASAPVMAQEPSLDLASVMVRTDGGEADLASIIPDAPAIVHFWATWCAPCREELPEVEAFAATLSELGLADRLVLISVDRSDHADVVAFLTDLGVDLATVQDPSGRVGMVFTLFGYPSTVLLDAGHALAARYPGAIAWTEPETRNRLLRHLQAE